MTGRFRWLKGHGTENDFVVLPDPDGTVHGSLDTALVRELCHRRRGIGADGVLRAVRSQAYDDSAARAAADAGAEWFMDYRNADGSLSQMCGNGVRLFARFLAYEGLVAPTAPVRIGTRDGVKVVRWRADGPPRCAARRPLWRNACLRTFRRRCRPRRS
jgi:diaminopimelate epimerase